MLLNGVYLCIRYDMVHFEPPKTNLTSEAYLHLLFPPTKKALLIHKHTPAVDLKPAVAEHCIVDWLQRFLVSYSMCFFCSNENLQLFYFFHSSAGILPVWTRVIPTTSVSIRKKRSSSKIKTWYTS